MYSADAYAAALEQMLPPGDALPRGDSFLRDLLDALAQEFARVESAALNLFDELDPRTTLQLLPDWERVLGLPDDCTGGGWAPPSPSGALRSWSSSPIWATSRWAVLSRWQPCWATSSASIN